MKKVNFVNIIPTEVLTIIADKLYKLSNKDINNLFLISKYTSNISYDLDLMISCLGHKNALLNISRMKKGNVNMINYILSKTTDSFKDINELIILSAKSNNLDILNYWINYGIKITDYNICDIVRDYINKSIDLNILESIDSNPEINYKIELEKKYNYIELDIIESIVKNPSNNYTIFLMIDEVFSKKINHISSIYDKTIYIKFINKYLDMIYNLICLLIDNRYNMLSAYAYISKCSKIYNKEFRHKLINYFCQTQTFIAQFDSRFREYSYDNTGYLFNDYDNEYEALYDEDLLLFINYGLDKLIIFKISCKYNFENHIKYSLNFDIDLSDVDITEMNIYKITYLPTDILLSLLEKKLNCEVLLESTAYSKNIDILKYFIKNKYNVNINYLLLLAIDDSFYKRYTLYERSPKYKPVGYGYSYYKKNNIDYNQINFNYIKFILDIGADINYNNNKIMRYIFYSFFLVINYDLFKLLLNYGADIKFDNYYPLRFATKSYGKDIIKTLIDLGSDINANNNEPIKNAILNTNLNAVELLIDYGAEIDYGCYRILLSILLDKMIIYKKEKLKIISDILDYVLKKRLYPTDLSTKLINDNIDVNHMNIIRRAPLFTMDSILEVVIYYNHTSIVKLFLLSGIKYNNFSLLKTAIDNNNINIVKLLVSYGIPDEDYINGMQYSKDLDRKDIENYLFYAKKINEMYK